MWKGSTAWDCGHRGKVIQSCMENTRDVVETTNSVWGTRVVGYGALQNLGENFNHFALESKHRAHSSGMEGVMLSHLSFSVAIQRDTALGYGTARPARSVHHTHVTM